MEKYTPSTYIDLRHLIKTCWRNVCFILLAIIVFVGAAYAYHKMDSELQNEYQTAFTFIAIPESVNTAHGHLSNTDVSAAVNLGTSYSEIFSQARVVEQIKEFSGINPETKVRVEHYETTSPIIFGFRITSSDPSTVSMFAKTMITCMQDEDFGQMPGSRAVVAEEPFYPVSAISATSGLSGKKLAVLAALLAVILSVAYIFIKTVSKNYVTRPELLTKQTGLRVIGQKTLPVEKG